MELYDAIFYRKSTRKYSNKKVKEGLLEEVKNACSQITYLNKKQFSQKLESADKSATSRLFSLPHATIPLGPIACEQSLNLMVWWRLTELLIKSAFIFLEKNV